MSDTVRGAVLAMTQPPTITQERKLVWYLLAQNWTEDGVDPEDAEYAADLAATSFTVEELDEIVHREVARGFAFESLGLMCFGELIATCYYPKNDAAWAIEYYLRHPKRHWLNPVWLLGAYCSKSIIKRFWPRLREHIVSLRSTP